LQALIAQEKPLLHRSFLPNEAGSPVFINADLIAAGLAPFQPERAAFKAGRLILNEIHGYVLNGDNFAFETTLSGRVYARAIPEWQELGFCVKLFFFDCNQLSWQLFGYDKESMQEAIIFLS